METAATISRVCVYVCVGFLSGPPSQCRKIPKGARVPRGGKQRWKGASRPWTQGAEYVCQVPCQARKSVQEKCERGNAYVTPKAVTEVVPGKRKQSGERERVCTRQPWAPRSPGGGVGGCPGSCHPGALAHASAPSSLLPRPAWQGLHGGSRLEGLPGRREGERRALLLAYLTCLGGRVSAARGWLRGAGFRAVRLRPLARLRLRPASAPPGGARGARWRPTRRGVGAGRAAGAAPGRPTAAWKLLIWAVMSGEVAAAGPPTSFHSLPRVSCRRAQGDSGTLPLGSPGDAGRGVRGAAGTRCRRRVCARGFPGSPRPRRVSARRPRGDRPCHSGAAPAPELSFPPGPAGRAGREAPVRSRRCRWGSGL